MADPHALIHPQPNATAIRAALALHHAVEDARPADLADGLRWPRFYHGFDPLRTPAFGPGQAARAGAVELTIDGTRAWPAELLAREPAGSPGDPGPARVFASLAHLKGRSLRNPAFAVLGRHGLLPRRLGYPAWLATLGRADGPGQ